MGGGWWVVEEFACGQVWAIVVVLMVGRTGMLRLREFDLSITRASRCRCDQLGSLRCAERFMLVKYPHLLSTAKHTKSTRPNTRSSPTQHNRISSSIQPFTHVYSTA